MIKIFKTNFIEIHKFNDSIAYCLLETVDVDNVVSPAPAGRSRPVCPAVAEEPDPRSAHAAALRALELFVFFWWVRLACPVSPLSSQLSLVRTSGFEMRKSSEARGPPLRSVQTVFLKVVRIQIEVFQRLLKLVFVPLLWALREPRSLCELSVHDPLWESVVGHPVNMPRPAQLRLGEGSLYTLQIGAVQHFVVGDPVPPCEAQDFLHAPHVEALQEVHVPPVQGHGLEAEKQDTQANGLIDGHPCSQSQIVGVDDIFAQFSERSTGLGNSAVYFSVDGAVCGQY